jgi:hypothetical protein
VNEGVQIAELKLEGGTNPAGPGDGGDLPNDSSAVLHLSLVIVGEIQDKQVLEVEISFHALSSG